MVLAGREQTLIREYEEYLKDPENYESKIQQFTVFGDFIVEAAASIAYNKDRRYLVIAENNGAIPNLSPDAMVEIPAYLYHWGMLTLKSPIKKH